MTKDGTGLMEDIKCIMNSTGEITQRGKEVRAVLRYLVPAIGRPTNFKSLMARPRLQFLGQDAPLTSPTPSPRFPLPPLPGRLEIPTVDGAAAAFSRRSVQLCVSSLHANPA